jgi:predicted lactoylglutathione lyase
MERRVSLITLGVRDLARSRAFYEAIGFRPSSSSQDEIVFIQLSGGVALALFGWDALAEDAQVSPEGHGFRGVTLAHNVRAREEVAPILAEAARAGGRIVKPAQDVFWGGHCGYFADLDGHLWEVAFNPNQPTGAFHLPD